VESSRQDEVGGWSVRQLWQGRPTNLIRALRPRAQTRARAGASVGPNVVGQRFLRQSAECLFCRRGHESVRAIRQSAASWLHESAAAERCGQSDSASAWFVEDDRRHWPGRRAANRHPSTVRAVQLGGKGTGGSWTRKAARRVLLATSGWCRKTPSNNAGRGQQRCTTRRTWNKRLQSKSHGQNEGHASPVRALGCDGISRNQPRD